MVNEPQSETLETLEDNRPDNAHINQNVASSLQTKTLDPALIVNQNLSESGEIKQVPASLDAEIVNNNI